VEVVGRSREDSRREKAVGVWGLAGKRQAAKKHAGGPGGKLRGHKGGKRGKSGGGKNR